MGIFYTSSNILIEVYNEFKGPLNKIGLCGKKGSGKTTVAKCFDMVNYSFATPIKEALMKMGIHWEFVHDLKEVPIPKLSVCGRDLMCELGKWGRKYDLWIKHAESVVLKTKDSWCFDDVRFPDEEALLRSYGALIIQIVRENRPVGIRETDESENQVLDPDMTIFLSRAATIECIQEAVSYLQKTFQDKPNYDMQTIK